MSPSTIEHEPSDTGRRAIPAQGSPPTLSDYAEVLRRRWLTVVVVAALVAGAGLAWSAGRTLQYRAATDVFLRPITSDPLDTDGQRRPVNMLAEAAIARSAAVIEAALETGLPHDATAVLEGLEVRANEDAQVLVFEFEDPDPTVARTTVTAIADSYLALRNTQARDALEAVEARLEDRMTALQDELNQVNRSIATLSRADLAEDAEAAQQLATAQGRQSLLTSQLGVVSGELAARSLIGIDGGQVLTPAADPEDPAGIGSAQLLLMVLFAGLLAGLAAAFVRDRLDPRVRSVGDVASTTDVPVVDDRTRGGPAGARNDPGRLLALAVRSASRPQATTVTALVDVRDGDAPLLAVDLARRLSGVGPVLLADGDGRPSRIGAPAGVDLLPLRSRDADRGAVAGVPGAFGDVLAAHGARHAHVIVVPRPVGDDLDLLDYAPAIDRVYVVVTAGRTRRDELSRTVALLRRHGLEVAGIVLDDHVLLRGMRRRTRGAVGRLAALPRRWSTRRVVTVAADERTAGR